MGKVKGSRNGVDVGEIMLTVCSDYTDLVGLAFIYFIISSPVITMS